MESIELSPSYFVSVRIEFVNIVQFATQQLSRYIRQIVLWYKFVQNYHSCAVYLKFIMKYMMNKIFFF